MLNLSLSQAKKLLAPHYPAVQEQLGEKTAKKLLDSLKVERISHQECFVKSTLGTFREGREISCVWLSATVWEGSVGSVLTIQIGVWTDDGTNKITDLPLLRGI